MLFFFMCAGAWVLTATLLATRGGKIEGNREVFNPVTLANDYLSSAISNSEIELPGENQDLSMG